MTLYPDSSEAVVYRQPGTRSAPTERGASGQPTPPEVASVPTGEARLQTRPAADLAAANAERSGRRARGRSRRYVVANGCTRLATFTYAPDEHGERPRDPERVKRDWAAFARELKRRWPELAWLRVLERHQDGHLHVHAALSRYVPKRELAAAWGHGFVDVRRLRTKRGGRADARAVAVYVAKYLAKDPVTGGHRYEVSQGFAVRRELLRAWTRDAAWRTVVGAMGGELPSYQWDSDGADDWLGPPVSFLAWA